MKVFTTKNPWALLIACGAKQIETRSWQAPRELIGQRIAIHASKAFDEESKSYMMHYPRFRAAVHRAVEQGYIKGHQVKDIPCGAVVALATLKASIPTTDIGLRQVASLLTEAERAFGGFGPGRWMWVLEDVRAIHPIPASGKLGFWDWEPPDWLTYLTDEERAEQGAENVRQSKEQYEREKALKVKANA